MLLVRKKPEYDRNTRLSKIFATARISPDLVVLGSSRSDHGIDVRHQLVEYSARRPYNLSLDGTRIGELEAYFRHALASGRLHSVIVGLDFHMFAVDPPAAIENVALLDDVGHDARLRRFAKMASLSITADALRSSVATVRRQNEAEPYDTAHGQREDKLFRARADEMGGAGNYFRMWDAKEAESYARISRRRSMGRFADAKAKQLAAFTRILELARSHGVRVFLFISPAHARNMTLIAATGQWNDFEEWKRELVKIVDAQRAIAPSTLAVSLWDFSGFNSITTEAVPRDGDASATMYGYWDASHYKRVVGNRILDIILGERGGSVDAAASEFGRALSTANIESHLQSVREAKTSYEQAHRVDVEEIDALVGRANSTIASERGR